MKKYMVISITDEEQHACFFDNITEVENHRLSTVCGFGGEAFVYELNEDTEEYECIF